MMKQFYKRIVTGLALLLILAASLGMLTMAQADTTDSYAFSVDYDPTFCTVKLTYSGNTVTMADGETYYIPKNDAEITIRIVPTSGGYEVDSVTSKIDGDEYVLSDKTTFTSTLTTDDELLITCVAKTFDIEYSYDEGLGFTKPTGGSFPNEYTFGTETKISNPELRGYTFDYWLLLTSKNANVETAPKLYPDKDGYALIPTSTVPSDGNTIYLKAMWTPIEYEVYRFDYVYSPIVAGTHQGDLLSKEADQLTVWMAQMGSIVNGNMGDDKHYPGYHYPGTSEYYSPDVKVTLSQPGEQINKVYRLFLPNEYELAFVAGYDGELTFAEGVSAPTKHVFNADTEIPDPIRTGYVFTGWQVTVVKNGTDGNVNAGTELTLDAEDEKWAGDKDTVLTLTATWKADEYQVTLDRNVGGDDDVSVYSEKYVYDKGLTIPDPVRSGYTFLGWLVNGGTEPQSGTLPAFTYAEDITLVAQWKANDYTVTFDGNGATVAGLDKLTATFDSAVNAAPLKAALPTREGHEFCGFTLTRDGTDYLFDSEGNYLRSAWDIPENTVVYAKWNVLSYEVSVNAVNAKIFLNDVEYDGTPLLFEYGTTVRVRIEANTGYKVTAWEGSGVSHQKVFTYDYTVPAERSELDATVLHMITTPAFTIDYVGEIFKPDSAIADGAYRIQCGSETLRINVQNGVITVNDEKVTQINIPESFLGKEIEIMMFGDGVSTADSDPQVVTLASRPALPVLNNQIEVITELDRTISIKLFPSVYKYEFALSVKSDGVGLVWYSQDDMTLAADGAYVFDNLNPGTIYYVFIRVQAEDGEHPHGEVNIFEKKTYVGNYLNEKISALEKLKDTYGNGEMVDALIRDAIEQAKALEKPSATFYNDLEGIYNRVLSEIAFAQNQDARIAELIELRDSLIATEAFNETSEELLRSLCASAIASIKAAQTPDEITHVYNMQSETMKAVRITYLQSGDMTLISHAGLPQGTLLSQLRLSEFSNLVDLVDSAIKSGSISVANGNPMLLADAVASLRSLDVVAAYSMRLSRNNAIFTDYDGQYEIHLTLPESLRGISGMQVACYNAKTGVLEVLDTNRDGNDLVFRTPYVSDFVILGDPTVNLVGVIVALGLILLCQLIGIILLIARRSKHAKEVRTHALALPAILLTIRFLPDNAPTLVAILGALAILLQIVLIYLLLTSEIFYRRKKRYHAPREAAESTPVPPAEDLPEEIPADEPTDTTPTDEDDTLLAMSYFGDEEIDADGDGKGDYVEEPFDDEDSSADGSWDDGETLDADDASEEYGDEESTEEYEDDEYGFIEPAVDPRYSLPDDAFEDANEDSFAALDEDPDGEYTEDASESLTAAEEDAVWDYDDAEAAYEESTEEDAPIDADYGEETAQTVDEGDGFYEDYETDGAVEDPDEWSDEDGDGSEDDLSETPADAADPEDGEPVDGDEDPDGETPTDGEPDDETPEDEDPDGDEFYFEPDARGDDAPPPEYFDDVDSKNN